MVNDVSDRGEQSCLSTRGFIVSTHHVFSFSVFSNVLARLAVIALWAKLSKIHNNKTQTFKLHLLFNRNIPGNVLWVGGGEESSLLKGMSAHHGNVIATITTIPVVKI